VRACDAGLCELPFDDADFFELLGCDCPALASKFVLALSEAPFAAAMAPLAVEVARAFAPETVLLAAFVALLVSPLPLAEPLALAELLAGLPLAPSAALALEEAPPAVNFASLAVELARECALETVPRAVFIAPLVSPFADAPMLAEPPAADALALPLPASVPFDWPDVDWLFGAVLLVAFLLA
jgi:hypothetical protein